MGLLVSSLLKILSLRIEDVSHGTIVNVHSADNSITGIMRGRVI